MNISILFFLAFACRQNSLPPSGSPYEVKTPRAIEIDGLSFVAPPRGFAIDPMQAVKKVGAGWIAVIPYAYTLSGDTKVHFNSPRQWWGERVEGVIESIARAQAVGIKVMLKPQVYFPGSWPGGIDFSEEADWQIWESNYRKYIMTFVAIADSMSVPMFCVGTEFKVSEQKRPNFWRKLIRDIRKVYKGKLTYAANWDSFDQVPFW
ncbi:MAG TPA: hypothetical protein ENJ45_05355, partial [Phaeodactylibacter sp.]|nr:hypothetical protein [Phaeodactylibacter sp.]